MIPSREIMELVSWCTLLTLKCKEEHECRISEDLEDVMDLFSRKVVQCCWLRGKEGHDVISESTNSWSFIHRVNTRTFMCFS